ncbi:FkbM family methyltransferase [Desulfobacula phenolica]|uniref:Methyltransferase, FkbM family n=1 Tax=Desulfobacula phenolica TaxID=90732 RepID=A0A1H2DRP8_9BACT|nr:FkbM family methyltransferase [Desulfobacula phenolica]SDT85552.1 methyltransferase, FkbM family [Desulfobacula phenolica]
MKAILDKYLNANEITSPFLDKLKFMAYNAIKILLYKLYFRSNYKKYIIFKCNLMHCLYVLGRYEKDHMDYLKYLINDNKSGTIFDIGANSGLYTRHFLKVTNEKTKIIAIDPDVYCYGYTKNRFQDNNRVQVYHLALFDRNHKDISFFIPQIFSCLPEPSGASLFHNNQGDRQVKVDVKTLDSFHANDVIFIKLDVEGAEVEVIKGGLETIKKCRPILQVEAGGAGYDHKFNGICKLAESINYRVFKLKNDNLEEIKDYKNCKDMNIYLLPGIEKIT